VVEPAGGAVVFAERADELFPAASVIKLPLVMALFADAAAGTVDLTERMQIGELADGSGVLRSMRDVRELSLYDLAVLAIAVSDNTAANRLIDRLGPDRVNARMREWGCTQSRLDRRLFDPEVWGPGLDNLMTPRETASLLSLLLRGECGDRATSEAVLAILERDQSVTPLLRHLPPGTRVAHKPGWMTGVRCDAAVIWGARPVVIAVFGRDLPGSDAAHSAYASLGWYAYRWAGGEALPLPPEGVPPS
jgi:beta-lactamase class A